jgi:hypothetical protein
MATTKNWVVQPRPAELSGPKYPRHDGLLHQTIAQPTDVQNFKKYDGAQRPRATPKRPKLS